MEGSVGLGGGGVEGWTEAALDGGEVGGVDGGGGGARLASGLDDGRGWMDGGP